MRSWPHAPSRCVIEPGTYMVTAATYHKQHIFHDDRRLDLLLDTLLSTAEELEWKLEAWAVFSNHYHLVGHSPNHDRAVQSLTRRVHGRSSLILNRLDEAKGRRVWYQSWETRLNFQNSYMARLAYVHHNPVRHGLVRDATEYRWCSARWFQLNAETPLYESVMSLPIDRVEVSDDF